MKFASRREYSGYIFLCFCVLGEEGAEMKKGERTKSGKRRGGDSYFDIYCMEMDGYGAPNGMEAVIQYM